MLTTNMPDRLSNEIPMQVPQQHKQNIVYLDKLLLINLIDLIEMSYQIVNWNNSSKYYIRRNVNNGQTGYVNQDAFPKPAYKKVKTFQNQYYILCFIKAQNLDSDRKQILILDLLGQIKNVKVGQFKCHKIRHQCGITA